MPSNASDAVGAFSHLCENVPSWITRLSDLRDHTTSKRQEYLDAFKIYGTVRPRPRKHSSICSIRTDHSGKLDPGDLSTQGTTEPIRDGIHNHTAEYQSLVSTRYNLIIHYDGHTQQALEKIVRNIGVARNHLRRGKMSQLPLGSSRSGGMLGRSMRAANSAGALLNGAKGLDDPSDARGKAPQKEPPFDSADKLLEVAHSLCESAAYKFLRVGDCAMELNGVEENFNSLLGMARAEVERFGERRKEEPPGEDDDEVEDVPTAERSKPAADDGNQPQAPSDSIEVDDAPSSSASSESIDVTAFRVNRLSRF